VELYEIQKARNRVLEDAAKEKKNFFC